MKMSRRNRRLKREAARQALSVVGKGENVPGGVVGALHRAQNGQATYADVDFLTRVKREREGKDGYTNVTKTSKANANGNNTGYTFHTSSSVAKDDAVFHCAEAGEVVGKCPLNPAVPAIFVPFLLWETFLNCCKEYDTEWIALLKGRLDPRGDDGKPVYVIEGFYFPPQTASGAHVDVPTGVRPKPGTIGAIHSHVDMGVFWSGTDTAHSNWPVEIVINRREAYEALSRYQLKCGEWAKGKSEVRLTGNYVNQAIHKLVMTAFETGATLDKASRAGKLANIHPDDRAEIAEAIVHTSAIPASSDASNQKWDELACPNCHAAARYVRIGPCAHPWHSYKPAPLCLIPECVREKDHVGWHRRKDETYFNTNLAGEVISDDRKLKSPGNQLELLANTPDKKPENQSNNTTPVGVGTIPLSDDPTVALEDYCANCEGEGYVETCFEGIGMGVEPCKVCKGDGYSEIGRSRKAELGTLLC